MTGERPGKRRGDRRVERTKRLLQEALHDLLRERSYDEITVQHILDRADVGRSTFYAHFRNKDQLLLGELGRGIGARPLPLGAFDLFTHLAENHRLYRTLAGTEGLGPVLARLERSILEAWTQRLAAEPRADGEATVAPEVAARFFTGALMEVTTWWLEAGMPYPPERMNEMLERLVGASLAAVVADR